MIFVSFEQNRFLLWDKEAFLYITGLPPCSRCKKERKKEGMRT